MNRLVPALFLALLSLTACGTGRTQGVAGISDPGPDNSHLDAAVQDWLKSGNGPVSSRYNYTRSDLNGDGKADALVMFSGPHYSWCDINGCSLAVFRADGDRFVPVSQIFPVRGPLYISENKTDGWKDLVVHISGEVTRDAKNVALHYNGTSYPKDPLSAPEIRMSQADYGQKLFP